MSDWGEVIDQDDIIDGLETSLSNNRVANAWIFSGPIGSGRESLAISFAKKLLNSDSLEDNNDVLVIKTASNRIGIDIMRNAAQFASIYPQNSPYRIIIVYDADRMERNTQDAILKAIEEPAPTTIWILLTPSSSDLSPTIRSRSRIIHLKTPKEQSIIDLLENNGASKDVAKLSARLSGGHIGIAKKLAFDQDFMNDRLKINDYTLNLGNISDAVFTTEALINDVEIAYKKALDNKYLTLENQILAKNNIKVGESIPKSVKGEISKLEADKKREDSRMKKDFLDIRLMQIELIYRDLIMIKIGANTELVVNLNLIGRLEKIASLQPLELLINKSNKIRDARNELLNTNALPDLILESLFVTLASL